MASRTEPTFAGYPGENVHEYVMKCNLWCLSRGLDGDVLVEARNISLRRGLTGAAEEFAAGLEIRDQHNFYRLSTLLMERFPLADTVATIDRVMSLEQGSKSFDAYCEEALALKPLLSPDQEGLLSQRWAMGLRSKVVSIAIQIHLTDAENRQPAGSNMATRVTIVQTIELARFMLGSAI